MVNNIIIFGGSGFLGKYFCENLLQSSKNIVTIFDIFPPKVNHKNLKYICGNILSKKDVNDALKNQHYVFHLAGWSDLETSNNNFQDVINKNVIGTMNILECCKTKSLKKFIYSSSLYVFSSYGGFYKTSKQICEIMIKDYCNFNNIKFHILRFGSIYGPGAKNGNAIYDLIHQAIKSKKINYWGDGTESRYYIHARDTAKICEMILSKKKLNNYLTISGHESIGINDLLQIIKEIFKNEIKINSKLNPRSFSHYKKTPFTFEQDDSFIPNIGEKIIFEKYTDLSEGIYETILYEIRNLKNKI